MNKRIKKKRRRMMFAGLKAVGAANEDMLKAVAYEYLYRYEYRRMTPIRFAILGPFVKRPLLDIPKHSRWNRAGYALKNYRYP